VAREYRPNVRESAVISKLDHEKESQRYNAMNLLRQHIDDLSDRIVMKLIEDRLIDTTSKTDLEDQIRIILETLLSAEEFDVQFQTANIRTLVPRPNFISLFVTAHIIEKLIDHRSVVDIYGTDEEIYKCVNKQVSRLIPLS
jgi:hypothetical protein